MPAHTPTNPAHRPRAVSRPAVAAIAAAALLIPSVAAGQSASVGSRSPDTSVAPKPIPGPASFEAAQRRNAAASGTSITVGGAAIIGGRHATAAYRSTARYRHPFHHPYYKSYGSYYAYPAYTGVIAIGPVSERGDGLTTIALLNLAREVDPQLLGLDPDANAPDESQEPADPIDTAASLMKRGEYDAAVRVLEPAAATEQTEHPAGSANPARRVARVLALALAAAGDLDRAGEVFADAYAADPSLARTPLRGERFFDEDSDLRRVVQRASAFAHNAETHDAWLAVAILMQAEGRHAAANRIAAKAKAKRGEPVPDDATGHTDLPDPPNAATARNDRRDGDPPASADAVG